MPYTAASSRTERLINEADFALRVLWAKNYVRQHGQRNPAQHVTDHALNEHEQKHAAGLMRVNHVGEICAQALYRGQALSAKNAETADKMRSAAYEEIEHLAWCQQRLDELNDRPSHLLPLWYGGAFTLGLMAGLFGDRFNLGFLAETERQVEAHLDAHSTQLPEQDERSRAILAQMAIDEKKHAQMAEATGAQPMPKPVKRAMWLASRLMNRIAYRV